MSKVYVALGDSVTQVGSDELRYPERFFAFLEQSGTADVLRNVSVGGETSGSILRSQLTRALQVIGDGGTDTSVVTDASAPPSSRSTPHSRPTGRRSADDAA